MPYAELERQFADIAGAAELERVRATFGSFLSFLLFASEHGDATPIRLRQVDGATLVYTLAPALGAAGSSPSLGVAPCVCRWLATQPNATLPELERWMRTEPMLWSRLVEDFGSVASFVSAAPRELYAMASALVLGAGRSRERIILQGDSVLGRVLFGTSLGEAAHATTAGAAARDTAAVLEDAFLEALAPALRQAVAALGSVVCAVQLDVGRSAGAVCCAPASTIVRLPVDVTPQHLQFTLDRTTQSSTTCHDTTFVASGDALHRCGLLRDAGNNGHVVGLTLTRGAMRVSLPANVPPTFVSHMASGSVLLMGRAGCGKTTLLRYWAARAAAPGDVSVMVLDTYNEVRAQSCLHCRKPPRRSLVTPDCWRRDCTTCIARSGAEIGLAWPARSASGRHCGGRQAPRCSAAHHRRSEHSR